MVNTAVERDLQKKLTQLTEILIGQQWNVKQTTVPTGGEDQPICECTAEGPKVSTGNICRVVSVQRDFEQLQ